MGGLVRKARKKFRQIGRKKSRFTQLLQLFYGDWGFHCDPEDYFYARNLYLPYVFEHRQGMPVTLGAMVFYLAEALICNLPSKFPNTVNFTC